MNCVRLTMMQNAKLCKAVVDLCLGQLSVSK
jgi:hypothetical protein